MSDTVLTFNGAGSVQAGAGIPIANFSGAEPNGPIIGFTLFGEQLNIINQDTTFQIAPAPPGFGFAPDVTPDQDYPPNYNIDASVVLLRSFSPITPDRWENVNGFVTLINGLMASDVTGVSSQPDFPFNFILTIQYKDPNNPLDWFNPYTGGAPTNIQHNEVSPSADPEEPDKNDQEFTWDTPDDAVNDGTIIHRDGQLVAVLPPGVTSYVDTVVPGEYVYTFWFYTYPGEGISEPTSYELTSEPVVGAPDIYFSGGEGADGVSETGLGGIDFGGFADIILITDPSGIYTLVKDKRHDTLYNRADTDSIDVRIPTPYAKTGFLPGK